MGERNRERVVVGCVDGAYGVRGWVRIRSFTEPPERLFHYGPWCLEQGRDTRPVACLESRAQGKGFVARLDCAGDRDAAAALRGAHILVPRDCLEPAAAGEYYWNDLLGMEVLTMAGERLGRVDSMMATGANDVLVVLGDRRRLIPFLPGRVVRAVDLATRTISVDWDPGF